MPSESGGRVLFETNVLVYAANTAVPQHAASLALRNGIEDEKDTRTFARPSIPIRHPHHVLVGSASET